MVSNNGLPSIALIEGKKQTKKTKQNEKLLVLCMLEDMVIDLISVEVIFYS